MDDMRPTKTYWAGLLLGPLLAVGVSPAMAQLAQQAFQIVITRAASDCPGIGTTRPLGTGSNGDTLVAVACTNGERHVVAIHADNSVSYMSSCRTFETGTGLACFETR